MNRKLVGLALAAMLGVILVESYFLFAKPNQTANPEINTSDSTSPTVTAPSPNESSSESSDAANNKVPNQWIQAPTVPGFTVQFVDHSYVVPSSTSINPYTGEPIFHPSYTVENKTIDITIKNQPFVATEELTNLYYNVREKGHFEDTWRELYHITNQTNDNALLHQSGSEYTVISIPAGDFPRDGRVDFQVQAHIAAGHRFFNTNFGYWTWEASGWSSTQTITILASIPQLKNSGG